MHPQIIKYIEKQVIIIKARIVARRKEVIIRDTLRVSRVILALNMGGVCFIVIYTALLVLCVFLYLCVIIKCF